MGRRTREKDRGTTTRGARRESDATNDATRPEHEAALHMQRTIGNRATERRLRGGRDLAGLAAAVRRRDGAGEPLAAPVRRRLERVFSAVPGASAPTGSAPPAQAKSRLGGPGDAHELAADRVAHDVVDRLHAPPAPGDGPPSGGGGGPTTGVDFGAVRLHRGPAAQRLSAALGARAVTLGSDVFFGRGELDMTSRTGQSLVAHELTHVLQQRGAPAAPVLQRKIKVGDVVYDFYALDELYAAVGEDTATMKSEVKKEYEFLAGSNRMVYAFLDAEHIRAHVRGDETKGTMEKIDVVAVAQRRAKEIVEMDSSARNTKRALRAELADDPELLQRVVEVDGGRALLGGLIDDMGPWGKQDATATRFARLAIEKCFGPKVVGFTTAALIRLWHVLSALPESHVRHNRLKTILDDGHHVPQGSYSENSKEAKVGYNAAFINQVTVGSARGTVKFIAPEHAAKYGRKNAFDQVVLHEIGHSIDTYLGIMDQHQHLDLFGGWEVYESTREAAEAMVKGYTSEHSLAQDVDKDTLTDITEGQCRNRFYRRRFLNRRTKFKNIVRDPEIRKRAAQEQESDADYQARMSELYQAHPAVQAAKQGSAHKFGGGVGTWQLDDAQQIALGGRVFHVSYKGTRDAARNKHEDKWVSYKLAERKHKVSLYQWRAPGEWFAEVYANFQLGTLPESHPLYKWMQDFIAGDVKGKTAARNESATETNAAYLAAKDVISEADATTTV